MISNDKRVGKLSVVVERTFVPMPDFLLPRMTAGCVCSCQIVKWCNTCSLHLSALSCTGILPATPIIFNNN
jgi:hypothetical protein